MRRRPLVLVGAALVLAVAAPAVAQAPLSVEATAWWTRRPGAQAVDGFEVASAPDGPVSVAAVRLRVERRPLTKAVIVFSESSGAGQEVAAVRLCRTTNLWTGANPGSLNDAPTPDCSSGSVDLDRNAGFGSWSGDVLSLLRGSSDEISLLAFPGPSEIPVPPAFQIQFASVLLDAEAAQPTPSPAPASGGFGGGPTTGSGFTSTPADDGFAPSFGGPAGVPLFATPLPVDPGEPEETTTVAPRTFRASPVTEAGTSRPWGRLIPIVPVSLLLGALVAWTRRLLLDRGWIAGAG